MEAKDWIILNYTLPKEPSRVRVSTWRKLKKQGAVSIGQSMWVLPMSEERFQFFSELSGEVLQNGGEAYILKADFIGSKSSSDIIAEFNKARDEEYGEVLEKCSDFFQEMEKEKQKENYTFAEIEENEYELNKLMNWYKDIRLRDFFDSPMKKEAEERLDACRQELEAFSKKTFEVNVR